MYNEDMTKKNYFHINIANNVDDHEFWVGHFLSCFYLLLLLSVLFISIIYYVDILLSNISYNNNSLYKKLIHIIVFLFSIIKLRFLVGSMVGILVLLSETTLLFVTNITNIN